MVLPFCVILLGIAWAKGSLDDQWLLRGLVGLGVSSVAGYIAVAVLAAMIRTSLTLTSDGLVYETTSRGPDGTRTKLRIESPWNGVRAIRERLSWLGWHASCLEVATDHGTFSFRTTRAVHERLKKTIRLLAPNLSPDDWGNVAVVGTAYGVSFRAFPRWIEWMAAAPEGLALVGSLVWLVGRLYDTGLPPEMRHPTSPWVYGMLSVVSVPALLVLMTPVVVVLRNYLDVAHDGLRHEQCWFKWSPPCVTSTRTRLRWDQIRRIAWLNETHRGFLVESDLGALRFGQYLSAQENKAIIDEMQRHAPALRISR
jgi:hypothetical protein